MEDILVKLNECRKEVLNGLEVTTKIVAPTVLHEHDNFWLVVEVKNVIEPGAGGPSHGDAVFRNVVLRVQATHYASPLENKSNPILEDQWLICPLGDLEEGEAQGKKIGMVATHDCDGSHVVAKVIVGADFDIANYFSVHTPPENLTYEIVHQD